MLMATAFLFIHETEFSRAQMLWTADYLSDRDTVRADRAGCTGMGRSGAAARIDLAHQPQMHRELARIHRHR